MEDKIYGLLEKMYVELTEFKKETKENFAKIETSIENELKPNIKLALQGYVDTNESLKVLSEKVDTLQIDIDKLVVASNHHDTKIIQMTKELKKAK